MKKLAVVGSRSFTDYELLCRILDREDSWDTFTHIVSGGAKGADKLAEMYADTRGKEKIIFPAEWEKYGIKAVYLRNEKIVEEADSLIAFWDGESKGTYHSIKLAKKKGITVYIVYYEKSC